MINKKKILYLSAFLYLVLFGFKTIVFALDCNSWGDVKQDVQNVFDFCKIVIPLLIMGLSSYEFIKAVTAKDDKGLKKAASTLLKRFALAVVFFFLPVILNWFLDLLGTNSSVCVE